MPLQLAQRGRVVQGAEGAERAAQPPQADAQLVGGRGVYRLQHGAPVGRDLVGRRLHDERKRFGTGMVRVELGQHAALRLDMGMTVGPAERQAVAALGLAALGETYGLAPNSWAAVCSRHSGAPDFSSSSASHSASSALPARTVPSSSASSSSPSADAAGAWCA